MSFEEYFHRGVAFYKNDELAMALVNFEEALKIQPDNAQIRQLVNDVKELVARASLNERINNWG